MVLTLEANADRLNPHLAVIEGTAKFLVRSTLPSVGDKQQS